MQSQDPKLDMAPRDIVGRKPKALHVGIDGAVKIPRLGRLAASVEVTLARNCAEASGSDIMSLSGYLLK